MSDPTNRAEDIEQRYVGEHERTEELLEGLDPEQPDDEKTTGTVQSAAPGARSEDEVGAMSREDP